MSDEQPAALMGSSAGAKTMADGTLRLQIDIEPADAIAAFTAFGMRGVPVALARLTNAAATEAGRPKSPGKGPYGEYAKALILSGFFRAPEVWEAIGTDEEYLEWLKTQKSALSNDYSWYEDTGEGYCVPAHYRRVEHGSGTGHKPKYCAIPLTNDEHQLQHNQGHDAIGDREWWDKMRIKYVERWAQQRLKERLNYDSWTDVHPKKICDWAGQRALERFLPQAVRYYAYDQGTESQAESEA